MSPGEIRACYRLYAVHRRSNEICAFPKAILAMNDVGASADLAILLRLHTGLEGLRPEIGHGDTKDDLRPFRSFAKDSCIVSCAVLRSRRAGGALRVIGLAAALR